MLAKQYAHRLPADYDMEVIRRRAATRGPLWDATPGLAFKAFAMRQRGVHGAPGNVYASIYLWHDAAAAADFFTDDRFQNVVRDFGRPAVELWLPIAQARGRAESARFLYREDIDLSETEDRAALRAAERERVARLADAPDTVAAVSALDAARWRLTRFTLSSAAADAARAGVVYEVLHLARPGLSRLT